MPIYEYDCNSCGQILEAIQKINEQPLVECPRCGEQGLKKKTSLNTFKLKGSGWYRDGYGGKSGNGLSENKTISNPSNIEQKPSTKSPAA